MVLRRSLLAVLCIVVLFSNAAYAYEPRPKCSICGEGSRFTNPRKVVIVEQVLGVVVHRQTCDYLQVRYFNGVSRSRCAHGQSNTYWRRECGCAPYPNQ
jgi:hypothetical protein